MLVEKRVCEGVGVASNVRCDTAVLVSCAGCFFDLLLLLSSWSAGAHGTAWVLSNDVDVLLLLPLPPLLLPDCVLRVPGRVGGSMAYLFRGGRRVMFIVGVSRSEIMLLSTAWKEWVVLESMSIASPLPVPTLLGVSISMSTPPRPRPTLPACVRVFCDGAETKGSAIMSAGSFSL